MPISSILALGLDAPRMTSQQMADQALSADREARRMACSGSLDTSAARIEADAIADECARRALLEA